MKTVPLGEIFDIARGGSPRPIDDYITTDEDGVNWIMIGDAPEGSKYIYATRKMIRPEGAKRSRAVYRGDFLLTNSMSFGRPYILKTDGCIHDGWLVLHPRSDDISRDYFFRLLGSPQVKAELARRAAGATVKNLNIDLVRGVEVAVPPFEEQRRIADILDRADALRAKRREALALVDDLTQSIFLEMFGDPISNEHGHIVRPLIEWVDPKRPITYGILKPGEDVPGGVKYIRVVDMKMGGIDSSAVKRTSEAISAQYGRSVVQADDILISIRGHVGRCALVPPDLSGANITQDTARLAIDRDSALYVMECLRTDSMQYWMRQRTKGAAVQGINLGDIKVLPIPEPKKELQLEFAERAGRARAVLTSARLQLLRFDEMFASLQHRAFAGLL